MRSLSFIVSPPPEDARWARCGGAAWGASRRTSCSIASVTAERGSGEHERLTLVERGGTERELGTATSTLMPTVRSMAGIVSPVFTSARLSTKCQTCWGLPITRSASISFTVARMLGTSVAEMSSRSVACSSAVRVYSSRPEAVSITTYLNDSASSATTCSICSTVMSSASVGVLGAHRT